MIQQLGISSPVVRDGKVVKFHDGFQVSEAAGRGAWLCQVEFRLQHPNEMTDAGYTKQDSLQKKEDKCAGKSAGVKLS